MKWTSLLALCLLAASLQAQFTTYPPNMYGDSLHAPFLYGVASGDPTSSQVVIWTRVDPSAGGSATLSWEIAEDPGFSNLAGSGNAVVDGSTDHTLAIDVGGLDQGRHYWYRFRDAQGNYSAVGRTKTAPSGASPNVRMAIASCSSIYSGYFNAYRRIGERDDIDLMVHLGDYVYDFVDADEEIRVPDPYPQRPEDLADWRELHAYHLLDPDLRLARQQHPWVAIWDNHDIASDSIPQFLQAVQAFREYVPMRMPDANAPSRIYRSFSYGNLLDLIVLDYEQYYHLDSIGAELSALGSAQRTWLLDQLGNSNATWRIVANQKMFGQFSLSGFPSFIPFGDGPVADSSAWDGHNLERSTILSYLDQNNIDNTVILSGDIHMSFSMDLPLDYGSYNSSDGSGSVAVEFLPTSISRGNFDEAGYGGFVATLAQGAIGLANDHHVFSELESHGYGILDVRPDKAVGEYWYVEKGSVVSGQSFEGGFQVDNAANHWNRNKLGSPTVYSPATEASKPQLASWGSYEAFPNPAADALLVQITAFESCEYVISLRDALTGRPVREIFKGKMAVDQFMELESNLEGLPSGPYLLEIQAGEQRASRTILIQR